jgi:hypothetical protein
MQEVNLLNDGLVGPFNFQRITTSMAEHSTIGPAQWSSLAQRAPTYSVSATNIFDHPAQP